jgi:hypothetical protein
MITVQALLVVFFNENHPVVFYQFITINQS